jgi:hypothetical protein
MELPMAVSKAVPEYMYDHFQNCCHAGAVHQFTAMPVPQIGIMDVLDLFFASSDHVVMRRAAEIAPRKRRNQQMSMIVPCNGGNATYQITIMLDDEAPYLWPDDASKVPDPEHPAMQQMYRWAHWRYDCGYDWAEVWAALEWCKKEISGMAQLKYVWKNIDEIVGVAPASSRATNVHGWLQRFKASSGAPTNFNKPLPPSWRELTGNAQNTIRKALLLEKADVIPDPYVRLSITETPTTRHFQVNNWPERIKSPYGMR